MMKIIHKKTMLMWVLSLCSISGAFAQTLGFNYQAIIKADPSNSFEFYGETVSLNFLASSDVALRFTIVNALGQSDYIEEHYTSTNALGEVNLTVGSGRASQGTFQAIVWDGTQKQLSVEIDYTATGSAYQFSNTQDLLYLPHPINTSSSTFIADLRDSISDIRFDLTQNQTESKSTDQGLQYTMDLLRDDVATNKSDISSLQTAQTTQNSAEESAAITAVQDDVDANEAAANTAIALKEDAANKSTDGTLADDTDTKFPTEKAVKTYVDAQVGSLTTDDDITGATIDGASLLTISEGTTEITVDLSALEESAAITAVQDDVDANEAAANTAIALKEDAANKSTDGSLADDTDTKFPTEKAVKTYVDAQVGSLTTDDDITGATIDGASLLTISEGTTEITVDLSALEESAAITAVQDDVDANEAAANTAIALKEDAANKSTDGSLADDTDTKFPTEKAVKTYVDAQVGSLTTDDDITGATIDGASLLTISEGTTEITVDLSALEESAAITAVQDDVDANEAAANTAIALKEDAANKSTDGSLADDTDTKFPTEKAVKTYVDAQVGSLTTDDDITGATIDGASLLTISEGTTEITVDLSALEESAAITAVQDDVDANEAAANTAIALKEDAANKSTDGSLADDTDTKFPTEKAVKTYVDAQVGSLTTDDDITGATIDGASLLTISEGTTEITVDLSALEESAAITAVQDDVDANEAAANTAIALKEDAANKSTDGSLADDTDTKFPTEKAVKTYVDAQVGSLTTDDDITGATIDGASLLTISEGTTEITVDLSALEESAAITAVQDDVDANEAAANTAIALKEDAANKSTDGTLADDTDTKFPTEKAVKTYVDAQVGSLTTDDDITGATIDGASLLTISEGTTEITVDLSALEESAAITAVQDDVDANEAAANTAIALKEDAANKSTDVTTDADSDIKYPSVKAVKTYVDAQAQAQASGSVADEINEGTTLVAPSQHAVFEALALKEDAANKSTDGSTGR